MGGYMQGDRPNQQKLRGIKHTGRICIIAGGLLGVQCKYQQGRRGR